MNDYIEISSLILRLIYVIEIFILAIFLNNILKYIKNISIYNTINNISNALIFLSMTRFITAFIDYYYDYSAGIFTLLFNNMIYGYIIYIMLKSINRLNKINYKEYNISEIVDSMILDLNILIDKSEK